MPKSRSEPPHVRGRIPLAGAYHAADQPSMSLRVHGELPSILAITRHRLAWPLMPEGSERKLTNTGACL